MCIDVLDHVRTDGMLDSDLIRIHIGHSDLEHGEVKIPLQQVKDLTPDVIMERIAKIMQSYKKMIMEGITEISVGVIKLPRGEGRYQQLSEQDLKKKKGLVVIDNIRYASLVP